MKQYNKHSKSNTKHSKYKNTYYDKSTHLEKRYKIWNQNSKVQLWTISYQEIYWFLCPFRKISDAIDINSQSY